MSQGDRTAMNMNNMQQMNNMNMNVGAVPGGAPNGPGAPQMVPNPGNMNAALPMQRGTEKTLLNTYIYEYFLKNEMFDCARSLLNEAEVSTIQGSSSRRQSPSRRQKHDADGNLLNGIDENMDTDRKEDGEGGDRRDELPLPKVPAECPGGSFLFDWWSLFWDIFGARTSKQGSMAAMTYLNSTQNAQRLRQEQQQRLMQMGQMAHLNPQQQAMLAAGGQLPGQLMNAPGYPNQMMRMQNGAMNPEGNPQMDMSSLSKQQLVRQAMVNNTNRKSFPPSATPQQIAQLKNQQMMQQQMQRGQSGDGDINGPQRPQSPATGQTAQSPSKRIRVEGEFQGNGRGQPQTMTSASQVQASQMLLQAGINPNQLTQQQFLQFQGSNPEVQQKSIQAYAQNLANHQRSQLPKGGMPAAQVGVSAAHGAPMMHQTSADGGPGGTMTDFYGSGNQPLARGMSGTGGNHALQDYQMQLMLLEQQNKKRLMMARAEQDQVQLRGNDQRQDGSVAFQGMSPNATRAAPSPQPSQEMKRGTPKMGAAPVPGGPGSPLPDGGQMPGNRGSPAASIAAFNGQQNMPNGAMMRPPSSHPGFNGQMAPHLAEAAMNPALRQQQQAGRGGQTPQMWQQHAGNQTPQAAQQQMAQLQQQHQQQQQAQQAQQGQTPQGQPPQPPQPGQPQNQQPQQPQQPGQQQQGGGQGQPQSIGTPSQRGQNLPHQSMPPPSAPTTGNNGRPSSPPANQPQPPTPTQSNKPNPGAKKGAKDNTRKRPNKKAAAAAATTAAAAPNAATPSEPPTPTTPITPHPVNSFNAPNMQTNKNQPAGFQSNNAAAPPQQPTPQPPPQQAPQIGEPPAFSTINEPEFSLEDFDPADTTILDNFDFDSFLNTDEGAGSGLPFDTSMFIGDGGVEAGPGDS